MVFIFVSACGLYWSYGGFQVVVKMGAAFPLILVELLLDLSLLWILELLLNHWPSFIKRNHYLPIEVTMVSAVVVLT